MATDIEYDSFCRAYSRNDSSIKNEIEYSNNHNSSSGCYLTTILCNILNMPDNNEYLKTMRNFRNNVLQKDEKYKYILVEYDIVGPEIAKALNNDPLKEKVAKLFFARDIVPIVNFINNNKNEAAVNAYYMMTSKLKNFYNINNFSITIDKINMADIKKSGHGHYIQKKITLQ